MPTAVTAQILPAGPTVTVFAPPQNVSNDSGTSSSEQIAIDCKGNINLVWWDNSPGYWAVFFSRSIDGGITFSAPQNLSNDPSGTTSPNMALDADGSIYVVWGGWSGPGGFLTRSSDGSNFSAPVKIADNVSGTPSIAVGPDSNINLGWRDVSFFRSVYFSRSSDRGETFTQPILLSATNTFGGTPLIGVDSFGAIDIVWEGCLTDCRIWFSSSTDGGVTFSQQLYLATMYDAGSPLDMSIGPNRDINVVYNTVPWGNVFLERSTDGGASFTRTNVSNNSNKPYFMSPGNARIAIDSGDAIDVVWNGGGQVFFSRSTDQGASFASVAVANGSFPQIALDSKDNINLAWNGYSATANSNDVFFSRSSDAGRTFSTPQQLSNNTANSNPQSQIALDILGNPAITWVDSSAGNSEVFLTRGVAVQAPPPAPKKLPLLP